LETIIHEIQYRNGDKFSLYPFSDSHLGAAESAEATLSHTIQECAALGRFGLAIGVGDWLDCITKNDKRFRMNGLASWVEPSNIVDSQRRHAVGIYLPLKEAGQLICVGTGNHEEAIHNHHDDNVALNMCRDLHTRYAGYQAFIILKFHNVVSGVNHIRKIHSWHGSGAAQSAGARLNRLISLVNDIEADIYLMGHLHAMTAHTPDRLKVDDFGRIRSIRLAATITGSWLKTYDQSDTDGEYLDPTYGEEKGYKPSRIGCPIIRIDPEKFESPYDNAVTVES